MTKDQKGESSSGDELSGADTVNYIEDHGEVTPSNERIVKPSNEQWERLDGHPVIATTTKNADNCIMNFPNNQSRAIAKVATNQSGMWLSLAPRVPTGDIFSLHRALPDGAFNRPVFIFGEDAYGLNQGNSLYRIEVEYEDEVSVNEYRYSFLGNFRESPTGGLTVDVSVDGFECEELEITISPDTEW